MTPKHDLIIFCWEFTDFTSPFENAAHVARHQLVSNTELRKQIKGRRVGGLLHLREQARLRKPENLTSWWPVSSLLSHLELRVLNIYIRPRKCCTKWQTYHRNVPKWQWTNWAFWRSIPYIDKKNGEFFSIAVAIYELAPRPKVIRLKVSDMFLSPWIFLKPEITTMRRNSWIFRWGVEG